MDLLAHREPDERPSAVGDEASDLGRIVEISPHDLPVPPGGYVDLFGDDDADLGAPRPGAAQPAPLAPVAAAVPCPSPAAEPVPLRRHPLRGRGTFLPEALVVVGFLALGVLVAQVIYLVRAEPSAAAPARAASPAPPPRPPAEAAGLPAQRSPPPEAAPVRGPTPEVIHPDGAPIDPEAPPEPSLVTWPSAG